jgi:hypothetical protein
MHHVARDDVLALVQARWQVVDLAAVGWTERMRDEAAGGDVAAAAMPR